MSIERKKFEEWISTKDWICTGMGNRGVSEILVFDNDYQAYHFRSIQECWESWQASANREGYKLVPIEDTADMWYEGNCVLDNSGSVSDIYKAMIGACDD